MPQKATDKKPNRSAISPKREENYPEWYQQVIRAADLAELSPVRGCMVIKPWGYSVWENMQKILDNKFKETGHSNAYFPLFILLSYLEREAKHVEGFAKECAIVTHHRLEQDKEGKLIPSGELEEPFVVRPTSETIIGEMYSKWVKSHRDLPLLINQWANVVRWELRPRLFLRTAEFLWQEGHTAHATKKEAQEETLRILDIYTEFAEKYMAMPVISGEKTESERFPGAEQTYTIEAMMQDHKALQAGTSHFLGQNFAKACSIKFSDKDGKLNYAWTTSWGVSTRLIGGLIMTHSDDDGLVLPPRLSPIQVIIIPIHRNSQEQKDVLEYCEILVKEISKVKYFNKCIKVEIDNREIRGGEKKWIHVKRGTPIRLEIGPREVAAKKIVMYKRNEPPTEKHFVDRNEFTSSLSNLLEKIQNSLFDKAKDYLDQNTTKIQNISQFEDYFSNEAKSGFAVLDLVRGTENSSDFKILQKKLKVTPRCIINKSKYPMGTCAITGEKATSQVLFARSY